MGPVSIVDSFGDVGSQVPINPPIYTGDSGTWFLLCIWMTVSGMLWLTTYCGNVPEQDWVNNITVIGCSLSIIGNQSAVVDSKTKALISVQPATTKTTSKWDIWYPHIEPRNTEDSPFDPQIDGVSSIWGSEFIFSWYLPQCQVAIYAVLHAHDCHRSNGYRECHTWYRVPVEHLSFIMQLLTQTGI